MSTEPKAEYPTITQRSIEIEFDKWGCSIAVSPEYATHCKYEVNGDTLPEAIAKLITKIQEEVSGNEAEKWQEHIDAMEVKP